MWGGTGQKPAIEFAWRSVSEEPEEDGERSSALAEDPCLTSFCSQTQTPGWKSIRDFDYWGGGGIDAV